MTFTPAEAFGFGVATGVAVAALWVFVMLKLGAIIVDEEGEP